MCVCVAVFPNGIAILRHRIDWTHMWQKIGEVLHARQMVVNCVFTSFQVKAGDLVCVRELVAKCLAEYATTKCLKPNGQRLRWLISGRTARQLKHSYYKIAHLPTIPEYAC